MEAVGDGGEAEVDFAEDGALEEVFFAKPALGAGAAAVDDGLFFFGGDEEVGDFADADG